MDATEIAALTPYSAQREEIRREFRNFGVKRDVCVKTITDSQGMFSMSLISVDKAFRKCILIIL